MLLRGTMNVVSLVYKAGDTVVCKLVTASSKANKILAKLSLMWSKPVVISKVIQPNVVLLANPETGVVVRRAHVCQIKKYVQ
jgi:hypothetical protein